MSYQNTGYGGAGNYPGGYPGQPAAGGGYPGQPAAGGGYGGHPGGYPGAQHPGGVPGAQHAGGYPGAQHPGGVPGAQHAGGEYPGQGQPRSGYPGGYPGAAGGAQGVNPEVLQWFQSVDRDRSGHISANELRAALVNGQGQNFSDTACALMIGMFDQDHSGTINVNEFQLLYKYINQWLSTFRSYDRDGSGYIDESELTQAFQQMGFRFTPEFIKFLVTRSDPQKHQKISVDQFIVICVQVQRFTEAFRTRDTELKGVITISFEEFLGVALSCSV